MGEYEPDDSRDVTLNPHRAPGEPPPTGPREDTTRPKKHVRHKERHAEREEDAQDIGWRTEQEGRTGQANERYVRHSPQATSQAERISPQPAEPTGQPGERARAFRETRGGESGFGAAVERRDDPDASRTGMAQPDFDPSRAGAGRMQQGMVTSTNYRTSQQQAQQSAPQPGSEATVGTANRPGLSENDAVRRAQAHMGEQPGHGGGTPPRGMTERSGGEPRYDIDDAGSGYGNMSEAPDASQRDRGGRGKLKEEGER